ncbi:hypothetical protein [Carboxylicivirga taeanensis]|uniref:hypothetical protein n=1 Tax=Carboxylicivirga taeanensis TaxID=1416875 RepID=UPI003F6DE16E
MQRLTILLFAFLIYSMKVSPCDCDGEYSYDSEYYHCDVIVSGKVKKVFNRTKDSYNIEIEIKNIFKGDSISEFIVFSTPENYKTVENGDTLIYFSDCDIYLGVGEEWLIYAEERIDGKYGFGFCSATKKLKDVHKAEFEFLNYNKNLVRSNNSKFYSSNELDNSELISISMRGYSLLIDELVIEEIKYEDFELNIKIDKNGFIADLDSIGNKDYEAVKLEILTLEPFVPGVKDGEIVNSEYTLKVKRK